MYFLGFRVTILDNPFGAPIDLGWVGLPFTLLWIVGIINALNLVDGLDGLAGGVALVAVATLFVISFHDVQPMMMLFCAALGGAILGFLFYNFNPASIFMGDTGSMFLGFVLAVSYDQDQPQAVHRDHRRTDHPRVPDSRHVVSRDGPARAAWEADVPRRSRAHPPSVCWRSASAIARRYLLLYGVCVF